MDTRTGQIFTPDEAETMESVRKRLNAVEGDIVMLDKLPEGTCRRCNGTGAVKAGLFSRRFKPCRCTKEYWKDQV